MLYEFFFFLGPALRFLCLFGVVTILLGPCNRGNIKLDSKLEVRGELPQILGGCCKPSPAALNLLEDVLQTVVKPMLSPLALNDLFLSSIALNSSCVILACMCPS